MGIVCSIHKCNLQHTLNEKNKIEIETCSVCIEEIDKKAYDEGYCDGYHKCEDKNILNEGNNERSND